MLGAVFEGNGKFVLKDCPKPVLKRDTDVLIKVTGVGICGTDLHILQVPPAHPARTGIILGHEFTGEIVEVGSHVPDFAAGDVVLVDPHPGCGACAECKQGNPDLCIPLIESSGEPGHPGTIGIFSDGAMARYAIVPRHALFKANPSIPSHIRALSDGKRNIAAGTDRFAPSPLVTGS